MRHYSMHLSLYSTITTPLIASIRTKNPYLGPWTVDLWRSSYTRVYECSTCLLVRGKRFESSFERLQQGQATTPVEACTQERCDKSATHCNYNYLPGSDSTKVLSVASRFTTHSKSDHFDRMTSKYICKPHSLTFSEPSDYRIHMIQHHRAPVDRSCIEWQRHYSWVVEFLVQNLPKLTFRAKGLPRMIISALAYSRSMMKCNHLGSLVWSSVIGGYILRFVRSVSSTRIFLCR